MGVTQHLPRVATMGAPMNVGTRELVGGRLASTLGTNVPIDPECVNTLSVIGVAE